MRLLSVLALILLSVACSKNSSNPALPITQEVLLPETESFGKGCFTEDEFLAIAEGFVGFWVQFRDESQLDVRTKFENLSNALNVYSGPISLSTLAEIYEEELLIDKSNVEAFLSTLVEYKDVISSEGFSQCFYDELVDQVGENAFAPMDNSVESRWFLSTLAGALGAGPCITGPLAILDTAAYIATGVLTAPTGIGAIANWGGAVASFGYALSTIRNCP